MEGCRVRMCVLRVRIVRMLPVGARMEECRVRMCVLRVRIVRMLMQSRRECRECGWFECCPRERANGRMQSADVCVEFECSNLMFMYYKAAMRREQTESL